MIDLPTLSIVIGSAAINSINPFAIGVLVLLISVILGGGQSTKRLLALGAAYITGVFATYLIAGLGFVYIFSEIPLIFAEYLSIAIGGLLIFAGIIEIKEFFWYGKGPSLTIPKKFANKIHDYASTKSSVIGILLLGVLVAAVGLPSTGAPYLAILTILRAEFSLAALTLMVLYAFIFILPLIIILFMVASGSKISTIARWKEQSKDTMRLFIGLLLAVLGWMLILIANGTINFG